MTDECGVVYVLKFSSPLGNPDNPRAQARFYVGWARELEARLWHHTHGRGAAITRAAVKAGITFEVVFVMPGTRNDERAIKNRKGTRRWLIQQGVAV